MHINFKILVLVEINFCSRLEFETKFPQILFQLDYNGVANECKKRITELHDKISILNSDKEVIATQKVYNCFRIYCKQNSGNRERGFHSFPLI